MNEKMTGYHGTKKELVESICTNNFNVDPDINNELFLGFGIYFFYFCDDAIDWNIKRFMKEFSCLPQWSILLDKFSVIESTIEVSKDDILDLDEKDKLYKFELLIEKIKGKLSTKSDFIRSKNKTAAIINMMYKRNMINKKVISKTFIEQINTKYLNGLKNYPRKMFCVKDRSIILENKEKIDLSQNSFESIIYFYR